MDRQIATLRALQTQLNAVIDDLSSHSDTAPDNTTTITAISKYANDIITACQTPGQRNFNLGFDHLQIMTLVIGHNLDLFALVDDHTSIEQLAKSSGADPTFVLRVVRFLNAMGYFKAETDGSYSATPLSENAAQPAIKAWHELQIHQNFMIEKDFISYLDEHKYRPPHSEKPWFEEVYGKDFYTWVSSDDTRRRRFGAAMAVMDATSANASSASPILLRSKSEIAAQGDAQACALVDIGGGFGQLSERMKRECPDLPGRFILQDLPGTFERFPPERTNALKTAGIEIMPHNFYNPQPVKGAKFYYMRIVLHALDEEHCLLALKHTYDAMAVTPDYSKLLIHEQVLPDRDPSLVQVQADMLMMLAGGMQRSKGQWEDLLQKAGFRIVEIMLCQEDLIR